MKRLAATCLLILLGAGCAPVTAPTETSGQTDIDLSEQGLSVFPSRLLGRSDIVRLDISGNQIEGALPAEIRNMSGLRELDASDNRFTGIPAEVGQLSRLEILDFSNNQLTGIPHELGNLSNLRVLDLSGNDISQTDLDVIRQSLPGDVEYRL